MNIREQPEWITRPEAMRILMCGPRALAKLMDAGRLTVLRIPGARPKLDRKEVQKIRDESFRPATAKEV